MKNISSEVLKKIKKKGIEPTAKWKFLLKNSILWGTFAILILVGGIAASVVIFKIATNDWDIYMRLGRSFSGFLFQTLPYLWIGLLIVFIFIADYNFKHTKKGYKYGLPTIVGSSILISIILGFGLYGVGAAKYIENTALQHFSFYKDRVFSERVDMWSEHDLGLMAGEILDLVDKDRVRIESLRGDEWMVIISDIPIQMKEQLKPEMIVRVLGDVIDHETFHATEMKPWKGNFLKENKNHMRNR